MIQSQTGVHDSELAIVMEDTQGLDTTMDGAAFAAGHHAATLRRHLWREHLGLLPAQAHDASDDSNAQPPSKDAPNKVFAGRENDVVADPLSDELWKLWTQTATTNTEVFRKLFHADPDDSVKTFADYDDFLPHPDPKERKRKHEQGGYRHKGEYKQGHLYDMDLPVQEVRKELDRVRGHLVWMPLGFLESEVMAEKGLQINQVTESIYT